MDLDLEPSTFDGNVAHDYNVATPGMYQYYTLYWNGCPKPNPIPITITLTKKTTSLLRKTHILVQQTASMTAPKQKTDMHYNIICIYIY